MVQTLTEIDEIVDKYEGNSAALIQILLEVQHTNRWLSRDDLDSISRRLGVPLTQIYLS